MTIQKNVIAVFALLAAVFIPEAASADSLVRICSATGNCGVCDIAATAVTVGKWLITGAAGLALVVIVWASVGMATSGGNAEKIQEAKKQIVWAVLGVGLVFASFYLVMWIIIAFANPSNQFGYAPNPPDEGAVESAGLGRILDGTAWWNLCNEEDLRKKGDNPSNVENATADCKYWGDGTPCKSNRKSICFGGACVPVGTTEVQTKITALGGYPLPANPSACDYLAAVDRVFENYSCQPTAACNPEKIETGFCGGTQVCCEPTTFTPRVRPARAPAAAPVPIAAVGDEAAVRQQLRAGGVVINKDPCQDGNTVDCANVAGLPQATITMLISAAGNCGNCIIITGGTEAGHVSHGPGLDVVDIAYSPPAVNALGTAGVMQANPNFSTGYTCEAQGGPSSCGSAQWLHVEL